MNVKPRIQLRLKVPEWLQLRLPEIRSVVAKHSPLTISENTEVIGLGTGSAVILAINQSDGSHWALKITNSWLKEEAMFNYFSNHKSRHLPTRFYSIPNVGLAIPKLTMLSSRSVRQQSCNSPSFWQNLVIQLINALHELHQLGIIHGDIKPENIGLSETGQICLIDFDLSLYRSKHTRRRVAQKPQNIYCGTPYYASLRLHYGARPNEFDDFESAIFTLWELCSQTGLPWHDLTTKSEFRQTDLIALKTTTPDIPPVLGQMLTYIRETAQKRGGKIDYDHLRKLGGALPL